MTTKKFSQDELNKVLWAAADSSRVQLDAGTYKDYVLTMLFFKYLSDLSKKQYTKYKERFGADEVRIQEKMKRDRFYLPLKTNFDYIYSIHEKDNIGEDLNKVFHKIEEANRSKLEGLFDLDWNSESILGKMQERDKMIRNLIQDFQKIDLSDTGEDVIGNSYMYLISKFGADAGKKAGEFFTPTPVARLLARLARPQDGDVICDPAMGSGGLLLLAGEEIEKVGSKNYALYGQESTGATFRLARMNMFLHGKDTARLEWGDTLNNPLLIEDGKLKKCNVCVANPPFSLKKWGAENAEGDKYRRFHRGIPPKDKGDYAFISHMVETAKAKTGRVAVIVPHGVLFRGGAEGRIRKALLDENIIDAIIGLPAGLFQTTGIPVAILIIDRSREKGGENENKKDILFIEASKEFKSGKKQNTLTDENADKIVGTYLTWKKTPKFSRVVSPKEIRENDYNLNITHYVDTFVEAEQIDIKATIKELKEIEPRLKRLEAEMEKYLNFLGIK
jgi:type I restriction enzyme M protein